MKTVFLFSKPLFFSDSTVKEGSGVHTKRNRTNWGPPLVLRNVEPEEGLLIHLNRSGHAISPLSRCKKQLRS